MVQINPALKANPFMQPTAEPQPVPQPNAQPIAPPAPAPVPAPAPTQPQPNFTNPFVEAAERNREIRNVSFSSQDSKPLVNNAATKDKKMRLIIIGAAAIVALLIVIIVAVLAMSGNKSNPTPAPNNNTPASSNNPGSYICKKSYLESEFEVFGESVVSADESITMKFGEDGLEEIESVQEIAYDDADAVKTAFVSLRDAYDAAYEAIDLTSDPFSTTYKREVDVLKITRKASAIGLGAKSLGLIGIEAEGNPTSLTSDELLDTIEAKTFTCNEVVPEITE